MIYDSKFFLPSSVHVHHSTRVQEFVYRYPVYETRERERGGGSVYIRKKTNLFVCRNSGIKRHLVHNYVPVRRVAMPRIIKIDFDLNTLY